MMGDANVLHVEICQNVNSVLSKEEIENLVYAEINALEQVELNTIMPGKDLSSSILQTHVDSIICNYKDEEESHVKISDATLKFYVYRLTMESAAMETMETDGESLNISAHWILPTKEFHYLWESLYFDTNIKNDLLHFVETAMLFADHEVDANIISWNKVVLLHGPPGTGKTSLCKALGQKIVIRLGERFTHAEFVEINSHSLFSKWFSESAKLVMKLFNKIKDLLENRLALVCILIDEVESLAHTRKSCNNGVEPTDSIRVVNALLTQLDQIKRYPNVIILTTSNLSEAIDLAFVDRADIKQYIGYPTRQAVYKIYTSCLKELMRTNLVKAEELYELQYLKKIDCENTHLTINNIKLIDLSEQSVGLSGRILRKVPFLAHAYYIRTKECCLSRFLIAMQAVIKREKGDRIEDEALLLQNFDALLRCI